MSRSALFGVACVLVVSVAACSTPPPAANLPEDIAKINALRAAFVDSYGKSDVEALVKLYTADAVMMGNHQPTQVGRDAMVKGLTEQFATMNAKVELTPEETWAMGDHGFDRGTYKVTLTPKAGGAPIIDEGRYLVLLAKGADGNWLVSRDMENSTQPMPMPMPMPMPAKGK